MSAQPPDWLGAFRRAADAQREVFEEVTGIHGRTVYDGIGVGGDATLIIDHRCEDAVFAELERLAGDSHAFVAISEERGEVTFNGGSETHVVIDPIDGSMNARRTIPTHSFCVAVAAGPSMADVELGFVHDFGTGEEFVARAGAGAELNGEPIRAAGPEGHGLEVVGLEAAKPEWVSPVIAGLHGKAHRVRVIGTIAVTMSYVACGRLDAMAAVRRCRSVDAAASQLIVREAGGVVVFEGHELDDAPLHLDARYRVAAATEPAFLDTVLEALRSSPDG
jgi:myo-inositol-1(or 4)-monophosphatase